MFYSYVYKKNWLGITFYQKNDTDIFRLVVILARYSRMSRRKHPDLEMENWAAAQYHKHGSKLAQEQYPVPPHFGPIPEIFFQHPEVQAKFAAMKQSNMNPENKQRIPEAYPYYNPKEMMKHMKTLAGELLEVPSGTYSIHRGEDRPNEVYFEYPPKLNDGRNVFEIGYKFKIHLMFNVKYMNEVLHRLFNELIKELIKAKFPIVFKLLNFNPVTSVAGRAGIPHPIFNNVKYEQGRQVSAVDYNYGTNHAKKSEYGRLAESFLYSPTEIKKYQVIAKYNHMGTPLQSSTFTLDGTTKNREIRNPNTKEVTIEDGKDINEQYDIESIFDPVIVFYTNDNPIYTRELLQNLLTIFPDDTTQEWVLPNFYPRANVKINNMIYLANGDFVTKSNRKMQCVYRPDGPVCSLNPNDGKLLHIPPEYEEIQSSCSSRKGALQCNAANRFPLAVSNHKLCKWEKVGNEDGQCKPQKTYSQHLLLQDYNSLDELYDAMGQRPVLNKFIYGTLNGSLPGNYNGGRRTQRNKQSKKNKYRRTQRKR